MIRLSVLDSIEEIAAMTYGFLTEAGSGSAALSFGSTYEEIFRIWKDLHKASPKPDKELPAFFPADERKVGFDDKASNWGSAWNSFLSPCGSRDDRTRWASDAETYRGFIGDFFGRIGKPAESAAGDNIPAFNLIFLGMGPDGHTASLFPGDCPDEDSPEWFSTVLETVGPFDPPERLTLGPEVIAKAARLVLTVTGGGKAAVFNRFTKELSGALETGDSAGLLPPVRILRRRADLGLDTEIICDRAAAASLDAAIIDRITDRVEK